MIISASRRTDIPAFYADWFVRRLEDGFVMVRNPYNPHQVRRVSLGRPEVEAIVFWTRDAAPLLPRLPRVESLGHAYYVHYTITGYPRALERAVPGIEAAAETFAALSDRIGPERVMWRYDPILLCNLVDPEGHRRRFARIAGLLKGKTRRVTISFADFYRKTERNLKAVNGLCWTDVAADAAARADLAAFMASVAADHGMEIQTCSEAGDLSAFGIARGKCIDDDLLRSVFGIAAGGGKDKGQRDGCACVGSIDIGAYDTCLHGCAYCYATTNTARAARNAKAHDPAGPFLAG